MIVRVLVTEDIEEEDLCSDSDIFGSKLAMKLCMLTLAVEHHPFHILCNHNFVLNEHSHTFGDGIDRWRCCTKRNAEDTLYS